MFASNTAYGDGCYEGKRTSDPYQLNHTYRFDVDAGLIGCIPVEALKGKERNLSQAGTYQIISFDYEFICKPVDKDGFIKIHDIRISTDGAAEW